MICFSTHLFFCCSPFLLVDMKFILILFAYSINFWIFCHIFVFFILTQNTAKTKTISEGKCLIATPKTKKIHTAKKEKVKYDKQRRNIIISTKSKKKKTQNCILYYDGFHFIDGFNLSLKVFHFGLLQSLPFVICIQILECVRYRNDE